MEPFFVIAFGAIISASAYLLLSRNVLRQVLGFLMLSNGVNLSIFISGRLGVMTPPILPEGGEALAANANPLPQALILTAIVISFALTAFTVVLFERAYRAMGTVDTDEMREMEPRVADHVSKEAP